MVSPMRLLYGTSFLGWDWNCGAIFFFPQKRYTLRPLELKLEPLDLWTKTKLATWRQVCKDNFCEICKILYSGSQNATSLTASKKSQKKRCFFSAQDHCTSLFGRRGGGPQTFWMNPSCLGNFRPLSHLGVFAPKNHTKASLIHMWLNHLYSKMDDPGEPTPFFFFGKFTNFHWKKPEVFSNSKGFKSLPKSHLSGNPKALITSRVWKEKAPQAGS